MGGMMVSTHASSVQRSCQRTLDRATRDGDCSTEEVRLIKTLYYWINDLLTQWWGHVANNSDKLLRSRSTFCLISLKAVLTFTNLWDINSDKTCFLSWPSRSNWFIWAHVVNAISTSSLSAVSVLRSTLVIFCLTLLCYVSNRWLYQPTVACIRDAYS